MANTWHEVLTIVGRPESLAKLEPILKFTTDEDEGKSVSLYLGDEYQIGGQVEADESTPWSISIVTAMRRGAIGSRFDGICAEVPDLWMSSSSVSALDNRYLFLAGFGSHPCFRGCESVHGGDWEPPSAGDLQRLDNVWRAFKRAEEAALSSFRRGAKRPRKAIELAKAAQVEYFASGGWWPS